MRSSFVDFAQELRNDELANEARAKTELPAIGPYVLNGTRANENVTEVTLLVWDLDGVPQDTWARARDVLEDGNVAFVAYGTPGDDDSAATRKVRLILPLARPLDPSELNPLRDVIGQHLGIEHDKRACDKSRIYFVGRLTGTPKRESWHADGAPVDPTDWSDEIVKLGVTSSKRPPRVAGKAGGKHSHRRSTNAPSRNAPKCPTEVNPRDHALTVCARATIAIEGQGGHAALLVLATDLVIGLELDPDDALALAAEHYNERCEPPWDLDDSAQAEEFARKFDEAAANKLDKPPGYLLSTVEARLDLPAGRDPAVDHVISRLAAPELRVYQRAGKLTIVTRDAWDDGDVIRPAGTPTLRDLSQSRLREIVRMALGPSYATLAADVLARGEWSDIRPLDAIVTYPIMRRDGSLLLESGYDRATRTLAELSVRVDVPSTPTLADARHALAMLAELVSEFPFVGDAHRSAWLAALLTPIARPAIDGPTPMLLLDASARGSGKTLLADVIAMIVTGVEAPRRTAPETAEEWRKVIFAMLLAGDPICLIDNVTRMLASAALDAILTGTTYQDRVLGVSEERRIAVRTLMIASANNCRVSTDLVRRSLACRLEPREEQPETRTGWRIPDLLAHVRRERSGLLSAALTIVRAYAAAGRPRVESRPMGSYEAWCGVVRDALVWAGAADPAGTQDVLRESADVERDELRELLEAWHSKLGDRSVTARELLDQARAPSALRDALQGVTPGGGEPTAHAIGNKLRTLRGQIVGGLALREGRRARGNRATYQVQMIGLDRTGRT